MTLEVGVLGPIEARREGEELTLGGPQQRRLLGVLVAAAGQVVPVDRLVEAVWPDDPPDGARRSVLTYVSRLRLALGDGSLVTQDPGYRLDVADVDQPQKLPKGSRSTSASNDATGPGLKSSYRWNRPFRSGQ